MNSKKYDGFTLIESLLVLLCTSVFLLVPLLGIKSWKEHAEVDLFFYQMERNIQRSHQSSVLENKQTTITPNVKTQTINYTYFHHGNKLSEDVKVQEPLILKTSDTIDFINYTGNIKKIGDLVIEDQLNKRVVKYQFQMGSGKVIRNERKK